MATTRDLVDAIKQKSEDLVLKLLWSGVDPNKIVSYQEEFYIVSMTPLLYATLDKDCGNIIKYLLMYGAKPDYAVLKHALMIYDISVIQELLKHGANAAYSPDSTESPLHVVICCSTIEDKSKVCELLLKNGVQVDHLDKHLKPPLFYAKDYDIIDVLLEYGAQIFYAHLDVSILRRSLFFSQAIIENMVRYAALKIRHADVIETAHFYQHFIQPKYPLHQKQRKMILQFAQKCVSEIKTMKRLKLTESYPNLFDFARCFDLTSSIRREIDALFKVFQHLSSSSLPIYSEVIMRKMDKNVILNVLKHCSLSLTSISRGKRITLNAYCMDSIGKCLSKTDILNLFTAIFIP